LRGADRDIASDAEPTSASDRIEIAGVTKMRGYTDSSKRRRARRRRLSAIASVPTPNKPHSSPPLLF
jgi:hypothetical protein